MSASNTVEGSSSWSLSREVEVSLSTYYSCAPFFFFFFLTVYLFLFLMPKAWINELHFFFFFFITFMVELVTVPQYEDGFAFSKLIGTSIRDTVDHCTNCHHTVIHKPHDGPIQIMAPESTRKVPFKYLPVGVMQPTTQIQSPPAVQWRFGAFYNLIWSKPSCI